MTKTDSIERLRTLNELLVWTGASDFEKAEHTRRALDFFSRQHQAGTQTISLENSAYKLARLHLGEESESHVAFAHRHVSSMEVSGPIWLRQAIISEMKKLAGRRAALLLITGMREAICPAGCRWTNARKVQYQRVRDWISELAHAWATHGSCLQVMIL